VPAIEPAGPTMKAPVRWAPAMVFAFLPGVALTLFRAGKLSRRMDVPFFSEETWVAVAPFGAVMLLVSVALFILVLRDR
jgi:hypothetical protein